MKAIQLEEVIIKEVNILHKIRKSKAVDNEVVRIVEKMKKVKVKVLRDKE